MAAVTLILIVFFVSTLLQVIWIFRFFSKLAFIEDLTSEASVLASSTNNSSIVQDDDPPVSVIVCAHNELSNLKRLIPVLESQDYTNYQIVVIDDRSNDGSREWLQSLNLPNTKLKLVVVDHCPQGINPKKNALLKGINAANNDILLLTDADCIPKTNRWIRSMSECYFAPTKIVLGYCGYIKESGWLNKFIRYETVWTAIQYLSRAINRSPYMGVGRNLSYRKSFFTEVGGLQGVMHLTGGDDDLLVNQYATRENTRVCLDKESFVLSIPKRSWSEYLKQKKRHLSVGKHYKSRDKLVLGIFSVTHIIFWSSLVSLLISSTFLYWVAAGFLLRQLALSWVIGQSSGKLEESFNFLSLPFLDFFYSLFYLYTGISALLSSKVTWQ